MRSFLIFIPILFMTLRIHAAEWEKLPSIPVGTGNFVCGTTGNNLLIAGGITWKNDTKIFLNDIWMFHAKEKSWKNVGTLPRPLAYSAFGQSGENIYFTGGSNGTNLQSSVSFLNAKGGVKDLAKVPQPLVYSGSAVAGSKLFVVAGATDPVDLKTATNSFYSVDLSSGESKVLADFPGGKWILPTAAAIGDRIFTFSGACQDPTSNAVINTNAAFVYSITTGEWKTLKPFPLLARGVTSCVLDDRYILLAGGYTNEFTDAAFLYDTQSDSYLKTTAIPYRAMASFIRAGEYVYCLGGEDKMRHRTDACYRIRWQDLIAAAKPL